jgi:hypothetical protein
MLFSYSLGANMFVNANVNRLKSLCSIVRCAPPRSYDEWMDENF